MLSTIMLFRGIYSNFTSLPQMDSPSSEVNTSSYFLEPNLALEGLNSWKTIFKNLSISSSVFHFLFIGDTVCHQLTLQDSTYYPKMLEVFHISLQEFFLSGDSVSFCPTFFLSLPFDKPYCLPSLIVLSPIHNLITNLHLRICLLGKLNYDICCQGIGQYLQ